jgi:hypothetical protein
MHAMRHAKLYFNLDAVAGQASPHGFACAGLPYFERSLL